MAFLKDLIVSGPARIIGTMFATKFSGDGSELKNIDASNITSGTLSADRLAKPIVSTITLSASNWSGSDVPYTYNLGIDADEYDVEISMPNTATEDQVTAIMSAMIIGNGGDNILRAWGEKPTVDIPVIVTKTAK